MCPSMWRVQDSKRRTNSVNMFMYGPDLKNLQNIMETNLLGRSGHFLNKLHSPWLERKTREMKLGKPTAYASKWHFLILSFYVMWKLDLHKSVSKPKSFKVIPQRIRWKQSCWALFPVSTTGNSQNTGFWESILVIFLSTWRKIDQSSFCLFPK